MNKESTINVWNVALPFSSGCLSARMWEKGKRVMVGVPELDIFCTGKSQSEATFRLFTTLLKYYNQLKADQKTLNDRQLEHFSLLKDWVQSMEKRMMDRELAPVRP